MLYLLAEKESRLMKPDQEDVAVIETCPDVPGVRSWIAGRKISVPIETPLKFDLNEGYPGYFPDYFNTTVPLFSDRLLQALRDFGVSHIDSYEAVILDREDKVVSNHYKAINIVGLTDINDPEAPALFRSTEDFDIFVNQELKEFIESKGIDKIAMIPRP